MNGDARPNRLPGMLILGLLGAGVYGGCEPDLDSLHSEYGLGGAPSAGASGRAGRGGVAGENASSAGSPSGGGEAEGGTAAFAGGAGGASGGEGGTQEEGGAGNSPASGGAGRGGSAGAGRGGSSGGGRGGSSGGGRGGSSGGACAAGLTTCPGAGPCETSLKSGNPLGMTYTDCGACRITCSLTHATSAMCRAGKCEPACAEGFDDCNASMANDGCEADLTLATSCGSCEHVCSRNGATTVACESSICVPECAPRYADCRPDDGTAMDDGCELYRDSLTACGATCSGGGVRCPPSRVCEEGDCVAPRGLAVVSVPFTQSGQAHRFGDSFSTPYPNLTNTTLTLRVHAPGAKSGELHVFMTDASDYSFDVERVFPISAFSDGWADLSIAIGGTAGNFDPSAMYQVTIDVISDEPESEPLVLYIDRIWSANLLVDDTFDENFGKVASSMRINVPGATVTWADELP